MANFKLEPDYADTFKTWKADPSPINNAAMLGKVQPIVDSALRHYGGGSPSPSLRSRAKLLAIDAFHTYNPEYGKLKTHIFSHMQGLQRYNAKEQNIISLPERVALDHSHMKEAENILRDRFGRDPSDAELSDHTGLSNKRLQYIRQSHVPVSEGAASVIDDEGDMGDPAVSIPGQKNTAWENFVYYDLGATDRLIMDYVLGRNGRRRLSVQAIAGKLRITPSAVSQRTAKIQQLLDMRDKLKVV